MNITRTDNSLQPLKKAILSYSLLTALYIALVFGLPANTHVMYVYNLSPDAYHILLFTITLPSLLVWFAAFYGYARLQMYARSISKTAEGVDFERLGTGTAWLAWSLPIPAILSLILNSIANQHTGFHPASIIIANYVALVFPLIGFSLISSGSRGLISHAKARITIANARFIVLAFVTAGVLYCYLTFRHFDLTSLSTTDNPYFLPVWLMVLSIAIPYLYAWFVGLLATYEISSFSKQVRGLLYRQALRLLAAGLIAVIVSSIALQYIQSVAPSAGYLLLNQRLVLIYIFRIVGGAGYVLLAFGVNRLKKIEDV